MPRKLAWLFTLAVVLMIGIPFCVGGLFFSTASTLGQQQRLPLLALSFVEIAIVLALVFSIIRKILR